MFERYFNFKLPKSLQTEKVNDGKQKLALESQSVQDYPNVLLRTTTWLHPVYTENKHSINF